MEKAKYRHPNLVAPPSRSEILQRKAAIRDSWSKETERLRRGLPRKPVPYKFPVYKLSEGMDGLVVFEQVE